MLMERKCEGNDIGLRSREPKDQEMGGGGCGGCLYMYMYVSHLDSATES